MDRLIHSFDLVTAKEAPELPHFCVLFGEDDFLRRLVLQRSVRSVPLQARSLVGRRLDRIVSHLGNSSGFGKDPSHFPAGGGEAHTATGGAVSRLPRFEV